ncbi:MAG: DUF3575 domain-containing protein [Ferruginibacter sp.]
MKFFIAFVVAGFGFTGAQAQTDLDDLPERNNIIKINLSALVFKNISIQYERKLTDRISFALNGRYMPFGKNPVKKVVEEIVDQPSVSFNQFRLGNVGITPELRFYTGKLGVFNGFYLGPFFSYNNYKTDLPISYGNPQKTGVFSGKMRTYTAGIQIGAQFKMGKKGYLDWWAIGPNYGTESGDFNYTGVLSATEQDALRLELEDLKNNASVSAIKTYEVNKNGASIITKGGWGGIRAMGFAIGYYF